MAVYVLVEGHIPRIYSQHALDFMGLKQKEKKVLWVEKDE